MSNRRARERRRLREAEIAAAIAAAPRHLYHGGIAGLAAGQQILPSSTTGAKSCRDYGNPWCARDRVYLTSDGDAAAFYAAGVGEGDVYLVEPDGPLEHDPDATALGYSFACESATIVAVVRRAVGFAPDAAAYLARIAGAA